MSQNRLVAIRGLLIGMCKMYRSCRGSGLGFRLEVSELICLSDDIDIPFKALGKDDLGSSRELR